MDISAPKKLGGIFFDSKSNTHGAALAAAMAAALMFVGSSGFELALILGLFGLALFVGGFEKSSTGSKPPKPKFMPPPSGHFGVEQPAVKLEPNSRKEQPCIRPPPKYGAAPCMDGMGDKQWYTQRIIEESRKHRWPIALRLLNEMQQCQHKPEAIVYNCMIGDCKKGSRLERATALFDRMESEGIKANVITYTALMNVAARRENADEAMRLFNLMKERQVPPNNVTYNTLVTGCSRAKQPERALEVLRETRQENGYAPDIRSQTIKELFVALQESGLVPASMSFESAMDAVVEGRQYEKGLDQLRMMMQEFAPAKNDRDRNAPLLHEMLVLLLEVRTRHDKHTLLQHRPPAGRARSAAGQPLRPAAAVDPPLGAGLGKNLFDKPPQDDRGDSERAAPLMQAQANGTGEKRAEGASLSSVTLISTFEKSRSMADARRLLKTMRDAGRHPNIATYNAILGVCDRHSLAEQAFQLYQEMLQDGLSPDVTSYNSLISASAKGGNPKEGIGFLNAMQNREKMNPTLRTYNALLDSCVQCKLPAKAVELFKAMGQIQLTPDASSYASVISACAQTCDWNMAVSALTKMQAQGGHTPDSTVYADAIRACTGGGKSSVAKELLKKMPVAPTTAVYNAMLFVPRLISSQPQEAQDRVRHNLQVWEGMQAAGVPPDAATFDTLLASCEKLGMVEKAVELFAAMTELRLEPTAEHHTHMFGVLLRAGRQAAAMEFFETMLKAHGSAIDLSVYNHAIAAYRTAGQYEKAFGVMEVIRKQQLSPNVSTYAELISVCQLTCDGDRALELMWQLNAEGLKADVSRWNWVIGILVHTGRLGRALNLVEEMRERNVHANTRTFTALIGACQRTGDAAAATRCIEMMCDQRLQASPELLAAAMSMLTELCMSGKALELQQMLQEKCGAPLDATLHKDGKWDKPMPVDGGSGEPKAHWSNSTGGGVHSKSPW